IDHNATLHVNDTATVSLTGMLHASDTDNSAADLRYSIVSGPAHGVLMLNGVAITDFTNAVFTQADIDKGLVTFKFIPTAGATAQALTDDSFTFTVSDGDKITDSQTFQIRNTVTQVWGTKYVNDLTGLASYDDPDATFHVYGFDGHDILRGGGNADTLNGGYGIDTADYSASDAAVDIVLWPTPTNRSQSGGDAQGDVLLSIENVIGSVFNDELWGDNQTNNILYGGAGNDTLYGDRSPDTLDGGEGLDTASYRWSSSEVVVDLTRQGGGQTQAGGDAQGDVLTGIENLTGSDYNDVLTGDSDANVLNGLAGDDAITAGAGDTVDGGAGLDVLCSSDAALDIVDSTTISGLERIDLTGSATSLTVSGDAILTNGVIDP
ncbi:hypothetical protein JWG42_17505, partial [Desulfoprunum benzoelyticum]|uniref:cadherin-like domain-containing protein n=1 Tax=Desulfoprunum benzoelyticum TaxID=1506996 RepID=UPI0023DD0130